MIQIGKLYHITARQDESGTDYIALYKKYDDIDHDELHEINYCIVVKKASHIINYGNNEKDIFKMIQAIFHFGIYWFIENDAILTPM